MAIETISYTIAAFVYLVFFAVLLTDKHRGKTKQLLLVSALGSGIWAASVASQTVIGFRFPLGQFFEFAKNLAWLAFLVSMLVTTYSHSVSSSAGREGVVRTFLIVFAVIAVTIYAISHIKLQADIEGGLLIAVHLMMAITGIVLIEQLYRNMPTEQRWAIKYLCLGLLGSYIFNFYMYSDALLYQRIDPVLWQTRGFVEALVVPLTEPRSKLG